MGLLLFCFSYYFIGDFVKKLLILLLLIPINIKAYSSSATSTVLMDMDSLNVIYSNNMNEIRSIASISNIMTT